MYIYVNILTHIHIYENMHKCTFESVFVCIYVYLYTYTCKYVYAQTYMCIFLYMQIHIYNIFICVYVAATDKSYDLDHFAK